MIAPPATTRLAVSPATGRRAAFTLVELLVSIGIISVLASMLLPALNKAKRAAQTSVCATNMKNWAYATELYTGDYNECLPPFGDSSMDYTQPFWHAKLAPYLGKGLQSGVVFSKTEIMTNQVRRCPAGFVGPPPFSFLPSFTGWNCWIGAHFGTRADLPSGPFYYADWGPPMRLSRIRNPGDAMAFMDAVSHYIYSPVDEAYGFQVDADGDGQPDTMARPGEMAFNFARPTVHNNGANVTLLDGHVERVPFKQLWKLDGDKRAAHSFWNILD